jgi:hypothetical protein
MSKGGAFFKFSNGNAGTSSANVRYITREKAAQGRIWTRNLPDHATEGETRKEQIDNLKEYARQREEDELEKSRTGSGQTRTHYRAIYSFDREVTDEQAQKMIDEHLNKNFPDARCVAAIHRDTDHTHSHIWLEARDANEKKINISNKQYKTLDDDFARTCAKELQDRSLYDNHINKKNQTQAWKREAYEARERGEATPQKPTRAADGRNQITERRTMHARQYGATEYDEKGTRRNQRRSTNGKQEIDRSVKTSEQAAQATNNTNREIENEASRLREAAKEMVGRIQYLERSEER